MMNEADRNNTARQAEGTTVKPWLRISQVLHPFDPSEDNTAALAHALRLACFARARLSLMCLGPSTVGANEDPFGAVRPMLERWKRIAAAPETDTFDPELRHLQVSGNEPEMACVQFLESNPTDLIVLSTAVHQNKMTWLHRSPAELLLRKAGEMTLFIPQGAPGFVSSEDGSVSLRHILVPVASDPPPGPAIEAARRIMLSLPHTAGKATLLNVAGTADLTGLQLPEVSGWTWEKLNKDGEVVSTIIDTAVATQAGLIVMSTADRHGFLRALRGTTTEHILRAEKLPLLAMPVGSFLG